MTPLFSGFLKSNFWIGETVMSAFYIQLLFEKGLFQDAVFFCKTGSMKDTDLMVFGPFPVSGTGTTKISRSVLLKVKVTKGQIANVAFRLL